MTKYLIIVISTVLITLSAFAAEPAPPPAASNAPARQPELSPKILDFLKAVESAAGDSELKQKLKERHNSAVTLLQLRVDDFRKGRRDVATVLEAARLAGEAKLDLADNADQRGTILEQSVELTRTFEARLQAQFDSGIGSKADLERTRYARLTAEVQLLKHRQKE